MIVSEEIKKCRDLLSGVGIMPGEYKTLDQGMKIFLRRYQKKEQLFVEAENERRNQKQLSLKA